MLGHYKIHTDKQNWENARQICEEEGAHLLVLNSQHEADSVRKLIEKKGTGIIYFWVGFHDTHQEGNYITVFSKYKPRISQIVCF